MQQFGREFEGCPPNNLVSDISQVAAGRLEQLSVFGNDYDTVDGTGVRDYIHVVDLAHGHLAALEKLGDLPAFTAVNLGTGHGTFVLEMISAFEAASGCKVPYQIMSRRPGDIAACYAAPAYALQTLGWKAERNIKQIMKIHGAGSRKILMVMTKCLASHIDSHIT